MDNEYITIVFQNGDICHYKPNEYTYNLDCIEYIEIGAEPEM